MSKINAGQYNPEISNVAKETDGNLDDIKINTDSVVGFAIPEHDDVVFGYDASDNITSIVYYNDGEVVASLTLAYTGSNLTRITKS